MLLFFRINQRVPLQSFFNIARKNNSLISSFIPIAAAGACRGFIGLFDYYFAGGVALAADEDAAGLWIRYFQALQIVIFNRSVKAVEYRIDSGASRHVYIYGS